LLPLAVVGSGAEANSAPVSFGLLRAHLVAMARLTIRIDFDDGSGLGPGKVRLLELVDATGSIRKAAAELEMSYRKAWLLLQALKETFGTPLVQTASGGLSGGGTSLTPAGRDVVTRYRRLERTAGKAVSADLKALVRKPAR
jgi:molybdate transport system regulatory protein